MTRHEALEALTEAYGFLEGALEVLSMDGIAAVYGDPDCDAGRTVSALMSWMDGLIDKLTEEVAAE